MEWIPTNEAIRQLESRIIMEFEDTKEDYTQKSCLLGLRKQLINDIALKHQQELLPTIIEFNDALTDALRRLYEKTHRIWNEIKDKKCFAGTMEVNGICMLSTDYSPLHPLQGDDRQDLWNALCDTGWNVLYDNGVTISSLRMPADEQEPFDTITGMDCPPPNWNEGLDLELTKDLHLTAAFHHLFCHTRFALTDIIYVRQFNLNINIDIDS